MGTFNVRFGQASLALFLGGLAGATGCAASDDGSGVDAGGAGGSGGSGAGSWGGSAGTIGGSGGAASGGVAGMGAAGAGAGSSSGGGGSTGGVGGSAPAGDPCQNAADGKHCGADLGGVADHSSQYECFNGKTVIVTLCPQGCSSGNCVTAPSDPCQSASGSGTFCGAALLGGNANTLYTCSGGQTTSSRVCASGCQLNPPGTPDACAANDPCVNASSGNGAYCGTSLPGGDPNKIYTCTNGATTNATTCPNGCKVNPPGTPDTCNGGDPCQSANGGNGPYCGGSLSGGDPNTLYTCTNLVTTGSKTCPSGCQQNPPGTADACKTGGSDPCASATAGNGEYCGGSLSGGDASKLYTCLNGQTASVVTCSAGCQQNPPGTPDQCKSGSSTGGCCVDRPPGTLTGGYSANCSAGTGHFGIDYGSPLGTPIYAGISGTVKYRLGFPNCYMANSTPKCSTDCYNSQFNYIRIKSDCGDPKNPANDLYVYYLHVDKVAPGLPDGGHVNQGAYMADVGNSGCSSGPHIHIEVVSVPKGSSPSLSGCGAVDPASRYCP